MLKLFIHKDSCGQCAAHDGVSEEWLKAHPPPYHDYCRCYLTREPRAEIVDEDRCRCCLARLKALKERGFFSHSEEDVDEAGVVNKWRLTLTREHMDLCSEDEWVEWASDKVRSLYRKYQEHKSETTDGS